MQTKMLLKYTTFLLLFLWSISRATGQNSTTTASTGLTQGPENFTTVSIQPNTTDESTPQEETNGTNSSTVTVSNTTSSTKDPSSTETRSSSTLTTDGLGTTAGTTNEDTITTQSTTVKESTRITKEEIRSSEETSNKLSTISTGASSNPSVVTPSVVIPTRGSTTESEISGYTSSEITSKPTIAQGTSNTPVGDQTTVITISSKDTFSDSTSSGSPTGSMATDSTTSDFSSKTTTSDFSSKTTSDFSSETTASDFSSETFVEQDTSETTLKSDTTFSTVSEAFSDDTTDDNGETTESYSTCDVNPCRNGGTCETIASETYKCTCPSGFIGKNCETKDFCAGNGKDVSCGSGACVYSENRLLRHCKCFSGEHWDPEVRDCRETEAPCFPNPCVNGGTCETQSSTLYKCECQKGFSGPTCEDKCGKDDSGKLCGDGECVTGSWGTFKQCKCPEGFYSLPESHICQQSNPPCEPDPCNGNGQCVPVSETAYNCTCDTLHSGPNCERLNLCPSDGESSKCKSGKCVVSADHFMEYCQCNEGFALEEATGECKKITKPCFPNPCANGGVCDAVSKTEFNCNCTEGFSGKLCTVRDLCKLDGGNIFCKDAICETDNERNSIYCTCEEGKYFDYAKRECIGLDLCPLMDCGKNQRCEEGKCICRKGFKLNSKTNECEPKFCEEYGCNIEGMVCQENQDNPEDFHCYCEEGKAFNGVSCEAASCQFPSLNACQQKCEETENGYSCGCHSSFKLKDNHTCEFTGKEHCTNKTCNIGTCVLEGEKEICVCPPGFTEQEGKCVDLCYAKEIPSGLCPNDECESDKDKGFKCKCSGKYKYAEDKVTCTVRKMCAPGEQGFIDCQKKHAICIDEWDSDDGYFCKCPSGYVAIQGICEKICDINENQKTCSKLGARCDLSEAFGFMCSCPPAFTRKDEECNQLAELSFLLTLPLDYHAYEKQENVRSTRRRRSLSDIDIDYPSLQHEVAKSMLVLFGGFKRTNVLNCKKLDTYALCKMEVQLTYVSEEENFSRLLIPSTCVYNESISDEACLLPPSLVLQRNKISSQISFKKTDICDEDIKKERCGEETTCESSPDDFTCKCKPGFWARNKVYPLDRASSFIEICADIDECIEEDPCPSSASCTNTIGGYECSCLPGYRENNQSSDNGCIELCNPNPCVHGTCKKSGDHTFECKCEVGYTGTVCNFEDKNYKGAKMDAIIVGVVLGGILLITIILFVATVSRLRKKKFLDEPSQILYSTEMMERRPVRLSAANPAFERD